MPTRIAASKQSCPYFPCKHASNDAGVPRTREQHDEHEAQQVTQTFPSVRHSRCFRIAHKLLEAARA